MIFDRDYNFKGKHANIVTKLTSEIDGETKFKFFERNIDVLILSPIVGLLYGRMAQKDDSGEVTSDNVKKINFDQMNRESINLNFDYQLIMLLHDKENTSIETRLDRAFRFSNESPEKKECDDIFESYMLGGIEVLEEKLLQNATSVDDYIENMHSFIVEYYERYNNTITEEDILNLCQETEY